MSAGHSQDSVEKFDPEKGEYTHEFVAIADKSFQFDAADLDRVQRRLKQRHVQMYVLIFTNNNSCSPQDFRIAVRVLDSLTIVLKT